MRGRPIDNAGYGYDVRAAASRAHGRDGRRQLGEGNIQRNCRDLGWLERQMGSEDAPAYALTEFTKRYEDLPPMEPGDPVWPSAQAVFDEMMSRCE